MCKLFKHLSYDAYKAALLSVMLFITIVLILLCSGCGHNSGVLTLGTRAHLGVDPQNVTADISYSDGLNITDISRENSMWTVEVDAVNGVSVNKDGSIKGIKKITRVIGPQLNGYLVDIAKDNPELAKAYVEAVKAYWNNKGK